MKTPARQKLMFLLFTAKDLLQGRCIAKIIPQLNIG